MKNKFLLLLLMGTSIYTHAANFDDWTNEDFCRWIDAISIPEPILSEIEIRKIACTTSVEPSVSSIRPQVTPVSSVTTVQYPITTEHGTLFPSPSSQRSSHTRSADKFTFRINYKIKL